MDVEMPDGTIISGVPEGITQSELLRRYQMTQQPDSMVAGGAKGVLGGVLRGIRDPIDAGAQLLVRGANRLGLAPDSEVSRVDEINRNAEQDYRQNWRGGQNIGFDASRLAGNVLGSAPMASVMPADAGMSLFGRTLLGGATGAGMGALNPVDTTQGDFSSQKLDQMKSGAMFGAAAAPVTAALSRVISPNTSQEVKTLLSEGVTPTPGQILGGAFKTTEEKLTSVPVLGDMIRSAQKRGWKDLEVAAANRALDPIGKSVPKNVTGSDAVSYVRNTLQSAYDDVLTRVGTPAIDNQFVSEINSLSGLANRLPKAMGEQLDRIIKQEIVGRVDQGRLTSEAIKAAESNLGRQGFAYLRSPDWDQRQLGEAILESQNILRNFVQRNAPSGVADDLARVNQGWANFKRIQRAASSVAAEGGDYTPSMLHNAVKTLDRTKDKRAFSEGTALMQDLSSSGKQVLADSVRNSGTADRLLSAATLGGLGALSHFVTPYAAAPLALTPAYTKLGQSAMATLLARRPEVSQPIAQGLLNWTPGIGLMSGLAGPSLLQ